MADITKCAGEGCSKKERCYRHTAEDSAYRQSYFVNAPVKLNENGNFIFCVYFWDKRKLNG